RETFRRFGEVLGLFQVPVKEWEFRVPAGWMDKGAQTGFPMQPKGGHPAYGVTIVEPITLKDKEIEQKLAERNEARRRKDFKRADEIRAELASFGITLEDRPDGTTRWKR